MSWYSEQYYSGEDDYIDAHLEYMRPEYYNGGEEEGEETE